MTSKDRFYPTAKKIKDYRNFSTVFCGVWFLAVAIGMSEQIIPSGGSFVMAATVLGVGVFSCAASLYFFLLAEISEHDLGKRNNWNKQGGSGG